MMQIHFFSSAVHWLYSLPDHCDWGSLSFRASATCADQLKQYPACQGEGLQAQTPLRVAIAHIKHFVSDYCNVFAEKQHAAYDF